MYKKMERCFSRCREGEKGCGLFRSINRVFFRGVRKVSIFRLIIWLISLGLLGIAVVWDIKTGSTRREPVVITYAVLTIMNLMAGMTINIYY